MGSSTGWVAAFGADAAHPGRRRRAELSEVPVPADVAVVTIRGRGPVDGWGGVTVPVELKR